MKIPKREWLQVVILAIPFYIAVWYWNVLPDLLPLHWGVNGKPDGYGSRGMVLFLPLINIFTAGLIMVLPRFDPKFSSYDEETKISLKRTFASIRLAITTFFSALASGILLTPLFPGVQVPLIACAGGGLLLVVIGNLMSKVRQNWFCGFRNPWTWTSREVWTRTHRLGGRLMMAVGFFIFLCSLVMPMELLFLMLICAVALIAIVPTVYSYMISKR